MQQVFINGSPVVSKPVHEIPIGEYFKRRTGAHFYMRITDKVSQAHEVQCVSLVTGKPDHVNVNDLVIPAKVGFVILESGTLGAMGAAGAVTLQTPATEGETTP
jgi:hypothetical protein